MKYFVEPIGASFRDRDLPSLAQQLTGRSQEGWRLHSVFQVSQPGCLGSSPSITYLAIYECEDGR